MILYHGTSELCALAILAEGFRLDPPEFTDDVVWLTDSPELAEHYGEVVLLVSARIWNPLELTYGERSPLPSVRAAAAVGFDAVSVYYPDGLRNLPGAPFKIVTVSDPAILVKALR